jgi:uncharacterized membrane protein
LPTISFDQPLYLLGLLLLPLFWWVGRRSLVDLNPLRRQIALALRFLIVTCLVLALSGVHLVTKSGANAVLFVVDASYSVPRGDRQKALEYVNEAVRNMRGQDKVGVLTVGGDARLVFEPAERGKVACDLTVPDGTQTNLARGITTALSYFPENMARRIVLVTDGNETTGSVLEAARSAAADDVPIDVIPVGTAPTNEALLERMLTPPTAKRGEPFPLKVVATSLKGGTGTVKIYRGGKYVGEEKVMLKPGKYVVTLQQKVEEPGFFQYEARLTTGAGEDTFEENNRAISFVKVEGKPKLLLVRPPTGPDVVPDAFLPKALAAQNVQVVETTPANLPAQATALLNYDGIILSDVPNEAMTPTQQKMIQAAVRDLGLGLVMIGGDRSFGAGGYYQTEIEEALPVDMDIRKMRRFPGVAVALSIDYSGSMNSRGMHTKSTLSKLELAQEAAHQAVDAMNAQDQVGVLAVDTQANIVVPLQPVTDKRAIHAGIGAIYGGSGTEMSAAVRASYDMLENADAKIKHAILITDGETGPYDYGPLIQQMREKKMTFSLVIVDEGQSAAGVDPLKRVVEKTGGRFYLVRDIADIPKIYTREIQMVSKPPILEEPFLPRIAAPGSPLITGIPWGSTPPLLGYDVVSPKPTAEVQLVTHKGDPLLASWQYGLGKSVAFTSDAKGRWGAQWVNWNGYGPFWAQILRWTLKKAETGSYQSGVELANGKGRITVDAVDENTGQYVNFLDARARVVGPDGDVQTVRLTQTGAGRYVGTFDANKTGSYVATVTQKGRDGKTRASSVGLAVPYSPEYAALTPNTALLLRVAEITGGKSLTNGETVFQERRIRLLPVPLAIPLLFFALLLFPLDVANRRLLMTWGQAGEMAQSAAQKARQRLDSSRVARERVAASSVSRLRSRKAQLEAEEQESLVASSVPPPIAAPPSRPVIWGNGASPPGEHPPSVGPPTPSARPSTPAASGSDYRSRLLDAKRRAAKEEED